MKSKNLSQNSFIIYSLHIETAIDRPVAGEDVALQYLLIITNHITYYKFSFCEFYGKNMNIDIIKIEAVKVKTIFYEPYSC